MKNEILVIEDDDNKWEDVREVLRSASGAVTLRRAQAFQDSVPLLITEKWHAVVLDMTLPTYPKSPGRPYSRKTRVFGGFDVLYAATREGFCDPVVVVTQFDHFEDQGEKVTLQALTTRLEEEFGSRFFGSVFYRAGGGDVWKLELMRILGKIEAYEDRDRR